MGLPYYFVHFHLLSQYSMYLSLRLLELLLGRPDRDVRSVNTGEVVGPSARGAAQARGAALDFAPSSLASSKGRGCRLQPVPAQGGGARDEYEYCD